MFFLNSFAKSLTLPLDIQPFAEYAVAPRVGAWIETRCLHPRRVRNRSRPVWARGLKLVAFTLVESATVSRPVWARGLKLLVHQNIKYMLSRAPCGRVD